MGDFVSVVHARERGRRNVMRLSGVGCHMGRCREAEHAGWTMGCALGQVAGCAPRRAGSDRNRKRGKSPSAGEKAGETSAGESEGWLKEILSDLHIEILDEPLPARLRDDMRELEKELKRRKKKP